jgi:DNA-binding IclR family transcriptional regulator
MEKSKRSSTLRKESISGGHARDIGLFNSSLEKGLGVLQAFNDGHSSLTLTQVASVTGLEKSAAQRFTATLVALGYLHKDPSTRQYSLTSRVLQLGASYLRSHALLDRATPYMLEWNSRHGEAVNLAEMDGADVIFILRYRNRHVVSPNIVIGSKFPWYISALGQAMVAYQPLDEREQILATTKPVAYASRTLLSRSDLERRLKAVRRDRFAVTHRESFETEISLAAPVFGPTGRVIAAVGTAVLATQWSMEQARERLAPAVLELAQAVSSASQVTRPE